jgi:hypothetical protein
MPLETNTIEPVEPDTVGVHEDRGPNMQVYSGRPFYPLDPRPEDVDAYDIVFALSRLVRYNGHYAANRREHYSIAQHSVLVSKMVPEQYRLEALLHDAAEAYTGDIVTPLKRAVPAFEHIEKTIFAAIASKFGIASELPEAVKKADFDALRIELATVAPPNWRTHWAKATPARHGEFPAELFEFAEAEMPAPLARHHYSSALFTAIAHRKGE